MDSVSTALGNAMDGQTVTMDQMKPTVLLKDVVILNLTVEMLVPFMVIAFQVVGYVMAWQIVMMDQMKLIVVAEQMAVLMVNLIAEMANVSQEVITVMVLLKMVMLYENQIVIMVPMRF